MDKKTVQVPEFYNTLPVPPEFADSLLITAQDAAIKILKAIGLPEIVIKLVEDTHHLAYYLQSAHEDPTQYQQPDKNRRFDIENVIIETLDHVAKCGAEFHNGFLYSWGRDTSELVAIARASVAAAPVLEAVELEAVEQ